MIEVKAQVVGVAEVAQRFETASAAAHARIVGAVQGLGLELLARVKGQKLTGQVLRVQTGRLRRSINEETTDAGTSVTSAVGTNVEYGRFWELGFVGVQQVRAATVKAHRRMTLAPGKKRRKGVAVEQHTRRAHSRTVNQAARPFLQPSLAEMRGRVLAQLAKVAIGVARGA